ncbi:DUF1801 domain-containing protein [Marinomonas transparens]|uniref:DUF1801 domain-containing protein n=1 Tax=Marinomonas transparens TaxID=2795388 RepID=A0A934MUS2_9GAMM|nr:DUF1801 domain-containing protein [Marinomonas transparens]MBJ7536259.1 DUF1801 domain-containing protein [Marinomonas transparens]
MKSDVQAKLDSYPEHIKPLLLNVRELILEIVEEQNLGDLEETLKWGEPSYLVKTGSTVRFDWKPKSPEQYCLYFNCKTKLVDTFREIYFETLQFQGNRAIELSIHDPFPTQAIRQCIELALKYKKVKHLPLLGA